MLNLFEEINYFKDIDENLYYPLLLNILNAPSVLNSLFPFIFNATQFLILSLIENNELIILKNFGIDNLKIIESFHLYLFSKYVFNNIFL